MTGNSGWQPRHDDPLFILAVDHRESFGRTLFDIKDGDPDQAQSAAMRSAKQLIFEGLQAASPGTQPYCSPVSGAGTEKSRRA